MSPDCFIPRHVTGLYMFTVVNLLALLNISMVNGYVTVYDTVANETISSQLDDMSAVFGGRLTEDGITGYLIPVLPANNNTCEHWTPGPPINKSQGANWIALIQRNGRCKFDEMVLGSQKMGYSCVIVYNSEGNEDLVRMGKDKHASLVNIPSVFVRWTDGEYLKSFQFSIKDARYKVTVNRSADFKPYLLWPFAVVVGTCFILMIVFMIFKWIRGIRRKKRSRLSTKLLKKIPTKKFKKGDAYDVCAICLDDYEEKDKLRILPCNHAYHCKCIDPWLTKNKKTCPVCKRKVIPGARSESESDSDDEENGSEASGERRPLLGAGNNNRVMTTPRSTFDNSAVPETARSHLAQVNETSTPPVQAQTVAAGIGDNNSSSSISSTDYGATAGADSSIVNTLPPSNICKELEETAADNKAYSSSSDSYTDEDEDDPDYDDDDEVEVAVRSKDNTEEEKKTNHIV